MADKYISQITPLDSTTTYKLKDSLAIENISRSGTTFTATRRNGTTFTFTQQDNNTATAADNILDGSNSGTQITYAPYTTQQSKLSFDTSTTNPTRTDRLNLNGYLYGTKLYSGGTEVKVKQTAVSSATAETTTATTFVYSVTQNANGEITVKTRPLPTYNNYSLPLAASGTRGGIQIGYSESGKNYAVKLSSEKAYVTVPWTDYNVRQTNDASTNADYRLLLSNSANDTQEDNISRKNANLIYNPSLNKLSTGNALFTGTLTVNQATYLNDETYAEDITTNSLLVNGDARFIAIPRSPTASSGSSDDQIATTEFVTTAINASVTGVKGNNESSYRTGNVNITPANILGTGTTAQFWRGDNTWSNTLVGPLYINNDTDAGGTGDTGSLIIGTKNSTNIAIDANEIMARNNKAVSTLYLNVDGGLIQIGPGGLATGNLKIGGGASGTDAGKTVSSSSTLILKTTADASVVFSTNTVSRSRISGDGHFILYENNKYTLGESGTRWKALYVGTADSYGSTTQPIYWNAGVPTAITGAIANDITGNAATATALSPAGTTGQFWRGDNSWSNTLAGYIGATGFTRTSDCFVLAPEGGYYKASSSSSTGALKITLPKSWTSTMMSFKVDIYDYTDNNASTYTIAGYDYAGGGGSWTNCSVSSIGRGNKSNLKVRFGHDGTKCCIFIGEINTTWSYPHISIHDFMGRHNGGTVANWSTGWSLSFVTAFPENIDIEKTNPNVLPIAYGGTGATTAADARTNLGLGSMATETAANYIPKSIGTTKGDIIYWSAASTPARLGIGSAGQVLKISSDGVPVWSSDNNSLNWGQITQSGANNIEEGSSDFTDNTEIFSSYASNNGFADTNAIGKVYRRDAIKMYNYIKTKLAVTNNNISVGWNTETTVATIGGTTIKIKIPANPNTNTATAADNILDGSNSGTQITYAPYTTQQSKLSFDTSTTSPSRTDRLNLNGHLYTTKLSTTDISTTGNLDVVGNATLHSQTSADNLTAGSLLVNGQANFVQIPTAPTAEPDTNNTQLATTEFVYNAFTTNDAMVFKGVVNANSDLPATHKQGWTYKIGTAGTYAGQTCEIGDTIYCIADGTSASNDHWVVVQNNIDILPIAKGGTGATTAANARTNLGALGAKTANNYIGMTNPAGADNVWIRTTTQGIIPYESGAAGSGHGSLGTSSWYFSTAYIDNMYGTLNGNATSATKAKYLQLYEPRATTTTLNKAANYVAAGAMFHLVASSSTSTTDNGKPPMGDSNVLQMNWDNNGGYDAQLSIHTSACRMEFRSRASQKQAWREVVTSTPEVATGSSTQPIFISTNGVATAITGAIANDITGNAATASKLTDISSSDTASSTATWRRVWFSYNDNATGRPAYSDSFVYQTSTGTLKATKFQGALVGNADTATTASKLSNTAKIGDTNKPVYFTANGVPAAINYTIDKSVPSNAVFTDRYVNSASFAHDATNNNIKMTLTRAGSDTETIVGNIPAASASSSGVISTDTQTFAGAKTFSNIITANASGNSISGIKIYTGSANAGKTYINWVKFASLQLNDSNHFGQQQFDIHLNRSYNSPSSEVYSIRINVGWNTCHIIQLGGSAGSQIMRKFRVVKDNTNHIVFFEYEVNPSYSSSQNTVRIKIICYHGSDLTLLNEVDDNVDSFYANRWSIDLASNQIVSNISGNATTATGISTTGGTTAKFWRGDNTWSDTISGGTLKITSSSNTFTIGSQNTSYNHLYNSANIPFIFNNTVLTTTGNLGNASYPFNNLYIGKGGAKGIYYVGTKATSQIITFLDNTEDAYGNGIKIGGGGATVIGAGESAANLSVSAGEETLYLVSDGAINIEAGGNTIANRTGIQITSAGHLIPKKAEANNTNVQTLGNASARWKALYVGTADSYGSTTQPIYWNAGVPEAITGAIANDTTGNAATATKVTQTAVGNTYTNWRPIIFGGSNSGTEGFTPSTVTDDLFTTQTLSVQPSTGTIRAKILRLEQDTAADPSTTSAARITFSYGGGTGSQPVHIAYTSNDSYRSPAGLKIMGNGTTSNGSSPAWLEVEGSVIVGKKEASSVPSTETASNRIIITPYAHTGGLWYIKSADVTSYAYLTLSYGSNNNIIKIRHDGLITNSYLTASQAVVTDANKNLISRGITNNTSIGPLGWVSGVTTASNLNFITVNTLAYWDGAYWSTNNASNLKYSANGEIMGLSTAQTVSATKTFSAIQKFTNTTDSAHSTDTTAAVSISGGLSVAKKVSAKEVRIDNNQTSKGVSMQYDATLEVLNFVFS